MAAQRRLLCVFAHPDDETLGTGGMLAKYAAEGVETYLVTATRGERGWTGDADAFPGETALGRIREQELRDAAAILGIKQVELLDYIDGDLDQVDPREAIARIVSCIRTFRPQVVITFGPDGAYGHPDHIAISQFTTAATVCAADASYDPSTPPHRVLKLYYFVVSGALQQAYAAITGGPIVMPVDGVARQDVVWPDWAITTHIESAEYWPTVLRAAGCHRSQLPNYDDIARLPDEYQRRLWGLQPYYRVYSLVNGGRLPEDDLFAGIS